MVLGRPSNDSCKHQLTLFIVANPDSLGFRIRIDLMQHFFSLRIRIPYPDPGFDDLKLEKIL
jgi:hypothetical protein